MRNTYNTAGQLDKVEEKESGGSFANVVDNIDYGPHGKPTFKDYTNGTESIYTYDANELYRLKEHPDRSLRRDGWFARRPYD